MHVCAAHVACVGELRCSTLGDSLVMMVDVRMWRKDESITGSYLVGLA